MLLVYEDPVYMYHLKDLRIYSLMSAYGTLFIYVISSVILIYLIFLQQTLLGFIVSMYLAYILLISITIIPISIVIVAKESNKNMLERSEIYSQPDTYSYFSIFEYFFEAIGLYGEDMRLHKHL